MAVYCDERGRRMSSWESDVQKKTPIPCLIPEHIGLVASQSFVFCSWPRRLACRLPTSLVSFSDAFYKDILRPAENVVETGNVCEREVAASGTFPWYVASVADHLNGQSTSGFSLFSQWV